VRYSVNSGIVLLSLSSILIAAAQISVTYCISIIFYLFHFISIYLWPGRASLFSKQLDSMDLKTSVFSSQLHDLLNRDD